MVLAATAPAMAVPPGLTEFLILATCFSSLAFGISYTLMRPWWRYQMGWNLFVLRSAIGLILLPYALHHLLNVSVTSAFYQWFTTVIFALVPLAIVHSIYLLFRPALKRVLKKAGMIPDERLPAPEDSLREQPREAQ